MDFIILFAKFYIYKCKLNELRPDILSFIRQLKKRLLVEEKVSENHKKLKSQHKYFVIRIVYCI